LGGTSQGLGAVRGGEKLTTQTGGTRIPALSSPGAHRKSLLPFLRKEGAVHGDPMRKKGKKKGLGHVFLEKDVCADEKKRDIIR